MKTCPSKSTALEGPVMESGIDRMFSCIRTFPELRLRGTQSLLRQQVLGIFNTMEKKRQEGLEDFDQFSDALNLGLEVIERYNGPQVVKNLLLNGKLDTILAAAMKVREKKYVIPRKKMRKRNSLSIADKQIPLSGKIRDIMLDWKNDASFCREASFHEFKKDQKKIRRLERLMHHLGMTKKTCLQAFKKPRSSVSGILCESNDNVSFLEIAVFVASFSRRFGIPAKSLFELPYEAYHSFRKLFRKGAKDSFDLNRTEMKFLHRACKEEFKDHSIALQALKLFLRHIDLGLNAEAKVASSQVIDRYLKMIFPSGSIPGTVPLPEDLKKLRDSLESPQMKRSKKKRSCEFQSRVHALPFFTPSVEKILEMSDDVLKTTVEEYPFVGCWHTLLLDKSDPRKTAELLSRVFQIDKEFAVNLFMALLTLEKKLLEENPNIPDIFDSTLQKGWKFQKLFALLVYDSLSIDFKQYLMHHSHMEDSVTDLVEDLSLEEKEANLVSPLSGRIYWDPSRIEGQKPLSRVEKILCAIRDISARDDDGQIKTIARYGKEIMQLTKSEWTMIIDHYLEIKSDYSLVKILFSELPMLGVADLVETKLILNGAPSRGGRGGSNAILDLPFSFILNEELETIIFPEPWDAADLLSITPQAVQQELFRRFLRHKGKTFSDVITLPEEFEYNFLLTRATCVEEADLELIERMGIHHAPEIMDLLKPKIKNSSPSVRKALQKIV